MVANVLKKGSFAIGEMVIGLLYLQIHSSKSIFVPTIFKIYFPHLAGRGVDLNRNWSVDWGKKEKVSILVVSHCAMEKSNSSWRQLYADSFKIYLELNLC